MGSETTVWRVYVELNSGQHDATWYTEEAEARAEYVDAADEVGKYLYYSPHHVRRVELQQLTGSLVTVDESGMVVSR